MEIGNTAPSLGGRLPFIECPADAPSKVAIFANFYIPILFVALAYFFYLLINAANKIKKKDKPWEEDLQSQRRLPIRKKAVTPVQIARKKQEQAAKNAFRKVVDSFSGEEGEKRLKKIFKRSKHTIGRVN
jgi:hypothetical protein